MIERIKEKPLGIMMVPYRGFTAEIVGTYDEEAEKLYFFGLAVSIDSRVGPKVCLHFSSHSILHLEGVFKNKVDGWVESGGIRSYSEIQNVPPDDPEGSTCP